MTLSYEEERLQNIAQNQDLLKSLGLDPVPEKRKPQPRPKPKRPSRALTDSAAYQRPEETDDEDEDESYEQKPRYARRLRTKSKVARKSSASSPVPSASTPRGTGRIGRRAASPGSDDNLQRKAQRLGKRTQNPKRFGHIPGVDIGTWWPSRMDCSTDAIHAPVVAGISGNAELGAWSVALSGGYADDVDLGETFTYTGCGGRDLKGTKQNPKNLRTAPQTFDQSFEHSTNASLKTSSVTKKPVRVIRGFKLQSPFAPATGYRYDGLYIIERAWLAPGLTKGLKVCKFAFKRVQGQPPLPRNDEKGEEDGQEGEEDAEESEAEATPGEEVEEAEYEKGEGEGGAESEDEEAEPTPTGRRTSSRMSNGTKHTPAPSRQSSSRFARTSNGYRKARASIAAEPEANSRPSNAQHPHPQPAINGKRRPPSTSNDAPQPLRVNGRRTSARLSGAATPADDGEAEADGKVEAPEPATKRIMARRYRPRTEVEEEQEQDEPATRKRPRRSTNNEPAEPEEVEIEAPAIKRLSRSNGGEAPSGKKEKTAVLRRSRRSLA